MGIKIAAVQPKSYAGKDEKKNLDSALKYIDVAAESGAKIVCFPEMYPGPVHPTINFDTVPLYRKAKEKKVYVIRGKREKAEPVGYFNICAEVIGPDGKSIGTYKRTTPSGPYVYKDIDSWGIDYVQADTLPVFETEFCKIGVLICSEVYIPELTRILALKGAEVVFFPSGGLINELLPTWRIMVQARAIENLLYTAACQNLYGVEEGIGMIAGPEGLLTAEKYESVLVAEIDLERSRWLRSQEEKIEMPKQYRVIPGTLRWRRPEIYKNNCENW
jgi:predicted amidohydrolase